MDEESDEYKCEQCGTTEEPRFFDENGHFICDECFFTNSVNGEYDDD